MSSERHGLCLVHLVWAPLGPAPLQRFIDSYRAHPAGVEHRLLVAMKGFVAGADRGPWSEILAAVAHEQLDVEAGGFDLGSYHRVGQLVDAERLCFTNSNTVVCAGQWLGHLDRHLRGDAVGIVGATGSHESAYSAAPRPLRPLLRDFDRFPNPHVRTNGFAISRELLLSLDWPQLRRKRQAKRLESARHGISRQVGDRGLELLIVGADGLAYPPERWYDSATFRSRGQRNQLLADNRTHEFDAAPAARRAQLEQMTWGRSENAGGASAGGRP